MRGLIAVPIVEQYLQVAESGVSAPVNHLGSFIMKALNSPLPTPPGGSAKDDDDSTSDNLGFAKHSVKNDNCVVRFSEDRVNGHGDSSDGASSVYVDKASFPQWMKTLENRWQRLHNKISRIPPTAHVGRFNWVYRQLCSQRQAKSAKIRISPTAGSNRIEEKSVRLAHDPEGNDSGGDNTCIPNSRFLEKENSNTEESVRPYTVLDVRDLEHHTAPFVCDWSDLNSPTHCQFRGCSSALEGNGAAELNTNLVLETCDSHTGCESKTCRTLDNDSVTESHRLISDNPDARCLDDGPHRDDRCWDSRTVHTPQDREKKEAPKREVHTANPCTSTGTVESYSCNIATTTCPTTFDADAETPAETVSKQMQSGVVTNTNNGNNAAERGGRNKARRRPEMRVFAKMSLEARHAVTETLREMGEGAKDEDEVDKKSAADSSNSDVTLPSFPLYFDGNDSNCIADRFLLDEKANRHEQSNVNNVHNHTQAKKTFETADPVSKRYQAAGLWKNNVPDKHVTHTSNKTGNDKKTKGDSRKVSNKIGQGSPEVKTPTPLSPPLMLNEIGDAPKRTHLPAITSRTDASFQPPRLDNIRQVNYRIKGVGRYRVTRECTFEITAPDFDIRYRDVITCQKGDRETPPPEIFDRSVGKVKDWLTKYYTPR